MWCKSNSFPSFHFFLPSSFPFLVLAFLVTFSAFFSLWPALLLYIPTRRPTGCKQIANSVPTWTHKLCMEIYMHWFWKKNMRGPATCEIQCCRNKVCETYVVGDFRTPYTRTVAHERTRDVFPFLVLAFHFFTAWVRAFQLSQWTNELEKAAN